MRAARTLWGAALAGALILGACVSVAAASERGLGLGPVPTPYSIAGGCYSIRSSSTFTAVEPRSDPFRMQASALGQYLLYGVNGDYLVAAGDRLALARAPSPAAQWRVDGPAGGPFKLTSLAGGTAAPEVWLFPAQGCAVYPEAEVGASGTPFTGASPEGSVTGTIDAHSHVTAFEFLGGDWHCGRPWDPFGIPYALPDCASVQQGTNGQFESFLDYGTLLRAHDTRGWPTFRDWPSPTGLAEEGDYWTGIERAWKAGLRIFVTQLVDNEALCSLMTARRNPCNDMASVRIQARALIELQTYIDAQSGGPGKGFFRIVTNPFQARQVINQGKLAVVEGIEVSHLFNCGEYLGALDCDPAKIDAGLKEVRALGVSTFFPVHKFDNAFGGTKMDAGETGLVVNLANRLETGHFWNVLTCAGPGHDSEQLTTPAFGALGQLLSGPLSALTHGAVLPLYPPAPHCNTQGLTPLGAYLIKRMIQEHFIVELDHMDIKTADAALSIIEASHYSGVISAHSWDSPQENAGIYRAGGFVTPAAGSSPASFISQWQADRQIAGSLPEFGFGYGADMNGLSTQSQPAASTGHPISYPFKSFDGRVTFTRETWGRRVFDLNTDGVANYGMYADWLNGLQQIAGPSITADMFHGAEAYLQMWERADGVPATNCRPPRSRVTASGLGGLTLGASYQQLLFLAGQPSARPGQSYRYCVAGATGGVAAVFNPGGFVSFLATTAPGYRAGPFAPGARAVRLSRRARRIDGRLWLGPRLGGGVRYLYGVRAGRVRFVAVTARSEATSVRALRRDVRAAGLA